MGHRKKKPKPEPGPDVRALEAEFSRQMADRMQEAMRNLWLRDAPRMSSFRTGII